MDGRTVAFEAVWAAEHPRLTRWMRSKLASTETADDLTEEAFARLWEHWDEVAGTNPKAWLWAVAKRLLVTEYRSHGREVWLAPWRADPDTGWASRAETRASIAQGWGGLTPKQQQVLQLHFDEGLSYPQVARRMGLGTAEAARGLAQRGWAHLRRWLADRG